MIGHDSLLQNSASTPYRMLTTRHGYRWFPFTLVVEVDCVNGKPLVEVLAGREFDSKLHVAAAQGHLRDLDQSVA